MPAEPSVQTCRLPFRAALALALSVAVGCSGSNPPPGVANLEVNDLVVGEGPEIIEGSRVNVDYTGWLYDPDAEHKRGRYFDSSRTRGVPLLVHVQPGSGGVIEGWHRGLLGMKEGGVRQLIIPPDLAYGDNAAAAGVIPPGATLVFEVKAVKVRPPRTGG